MTVTFCGHRTLEHPVQVKSWLREVVCDLIGQGANIFLLGGYGAFDLNFYIVIDRLPCNLKTFRQFFGPDFSSLAKDLDDGFFSAPVCVHILSPPHFLLQLYRSKIMSKTPLPFPRKI